MNEFNFAKKRAKEKINQYYREKKLDSLDRHTHRHFKLN